MDNWTYFDEKYGKPIGQGAQCHVYRRDDLAIKVLSQGHQLVDVMREANALAIVESLGIPTSNLHAVYWDHDQLVMEMKFVTGKETMEEIIACHEKGDMAGIDRHLSKLAQIQAAMHASKAFGLVESRSLYRAYMRLTPSLPDQVRENMLTLIDQLPDGDSLCHNDYHARNVMYDGKDYTVIDWDSATIGDPAGDVAHTYLATLLSSKEIADRYLELYAEKAGMDIARLEKWLPIHAMILYNALIPNKKNAEMCELLKPYIACLQ